MKRFDARKRVMEQLGVLGLLRGKRDHTMQVPFCSRSGDVVELLLKPQW
jgi:valyl-tRNA synthetase